MAYYDHHAESHRIDCENSFKGLKESLTKLNDDSSLNEYVLALEHIRGMENKLKSQEEEISKYRSFFSMLQGFLGGFSINDNINKRI